ncbi:cytochrome P450 [Whalleya microplaca]|nr:cytochrome P450 [Whalleya microplaca]
MVYIIIGAAVVIGYFLLDFFISLPHDLKEPQLIPPGIPFLGHIIGMIRDGSGYYEKITKQYDLPIYTLGVPRSKIYIVTSPNLISLIDRRSRTISFAPYVVQFAKRILIPSQHGLDALGEDLLEENGPVGLRPETLKVMHHSLSPGKDLQAITQVMLKSVTSLLHSAEIDKEEGTKLFEMTRKIVTQASTDAIYGAEQNPFQDPIVHHGFWAIDKDFAFLGLNVLSGLIAPKGRRGRKVLFDAMGKYYAAGGHETASRLIQARYEVNRKYGVSQSDIEHFDLSVCYGLLVNTVPSTSWAIYYLYSDPSLLQDVRSKVEELIGMPEAKDEDNNHAITVNIPEVIAGYPLLSSFVQEVLRVQSTNASGRVVLEDTLIQDEYLLKKDSILLVPSAELHSSKSAWGPTASTFDPKRFLLHTQARSKNKVPASAYRAFGSGASVCPGRHFAANEILTILIMMVLRYDVTPVAGQWKMPRTKSHITTSILTPVEDVRVHVKVREEMEKIEWRFVWEAEKGTEKAIE